MKAFILLVATIAAVSANPGSVNPDNIVVRYDIFGRMQCRINCGRANIDNCPPTNCVQPPADRTCARPDCSRGVNRQFVFPAPDPRNYFQCSPVQFENGSYGWEVLERPCGCQTLFSYAQQACVHPIAWRSDCDATSNPPPAPRECERECPTC